MQNFSVTTLIVFVASTSLSAQDPVQPVDGGEAPIIAPLAPLPSSATVTDEVTDSDSIDVPAPEPGIDLPAETPTPENTGDEAPAEEAPAVEPGPRFVPFDEWTVEIVPRGGCATPDCSASADYRRAYDAIPFSRAEWLANPSYRHDAAMSLVTGQPINGRTAPNRQLEIYQDPRNYRRTFFPRLSPADVHSNAVYGRYQYRPFVWGVYRP